MRTVSMILAAAVAVIVITSVAIPAVQSSAYDVVDNGESDGMRYTYYSDSFPTSTYIFSKSGTTWTLAYDNEVMTGELEPMLIFATHNRCAFVDFDGSLKMVGTNGSVSDYGNSINWNVRDGKLYVGSTNLGTPSFAVFPDVGGNVGSYRHPVYLDDGAFTIAANSGGYYWDGTTNYMPIGASDEGYQISFNRTGDKLDSVAWKVGGNAEVPTYEKISRDSLITLGNPIGTQDVTYVADWDPSITYGLNVTLYDDGTYMLNRFTGSYDYPSCSTIEINGTSYSCKVVGNGEESVLSGFSMGSDGYVMLGPSTEIINDKAFFGKSTLTRVDGLDNVIIIGDSAFEGTQFGFENTGAYVGAVKWIGDRAFYDTPCRISINWGSVIHIGDSAFESANITNVDLSSSQINYVGDRAFYGCIDMEYSVHLGTFDGYYYVEYVGDSAFENSNAFKYYGEYGNLDLFPQTVHIGDRAFANSGIETVNTSSSGYWGTDVFTANPLVSVINTGSITLTPENIGVSTATIQNGITSPFVTATIYESVKKDGLGVDVLLAIPALLIISVIVAVAAVAIRSRD